MWGLLPLRANGAKQLFKHDKFGNRSWRRSPDTRYPGAKREKPECNNHDPNSSKQLKNHLTSHILSPNIHLNEEEKKNASPSKGQ